MADPGIRAGRVEHLDRGDAVGVEVGGGQDEISRAVGESGSLVVGAEMDAESGGQVGGDDGEAVDAGAVGEEVVDGRVVGAVGESDIVAADGATSGDGSRAGDAGDDVSGTGFGDGGGEALKDPPACSGGPPPQIGSFWCPILNSWNSVSG